VIRVSDLNRYVYCPRTIYLADVVKVKPPEAPEQGMGLVGHAVRRELALRQARLLKRMHVGQDFREVLAGELDAVIQDIPHIFSERWAEGYSAHIPQVKAEVEAELELMGGELAALMDDLGYEGALEYVTPWRTEYTVKSKSLNLTGRVDKVMRRENLTPVEIKTGAAPDFSWEGDRIQLAAYGMLLEDRFNVKVPHGFIEYTRVQESRPVLFTEKLRRQVIHTRDLIMEILAGRVPDVCPHGRPAKCEACSLRDECYRI
jgi:CRISPR-associated protein Cas4